jgi:UDP-3-O-[3-hydroxymyristoyl] glucosamine N-acyltransferase
VIKIAERTQPATPVRASDVAGLTNGVLRGPDIEITSVRPVSTLAANCLAFAGGASAKIDPSARAVILVRPNRARADANSYIEVDNPRVAFALALARYFETPRRSHVAASASVSSTAAIDSTAWIGERVVIEDGVTIGARTVIEHGAGVCGGTILGQDCVVGDGAVIGSAGFGYERDADGVPHFLPHLVGLRIGNDVHIGPNCTIARGTIGDTEIGDHTKVGPQANISHNVRIGRSCVICGQSQISGSVRIGDACWIGPNCTIRQSTHIGARATIGLGVLVLEDVPPSASLVGRAGVQAGLEQPAPAKQQAADGHDGVADVQGLDRRFDMYVRDFFKLDSDLPLHDGMTSGDVPGWDSLANVNFLLGIGQVFGAKFDIETIAAMRSIGDVRRELRRHLTGAQR